MMNDLGVDPGEWFVNPLDSMPIATNTNRYHPDGNFLVGRIQHPQNMNLLMSGLMIRLKNLMKVMR